MQCEPRTARDAAVDALAIQVAERPMPVIEPRLDGLIEIDRSLAVAIHRTALQRRLTLEYLLDRCGRKPMRKLEPLLRAILLAAAAQVVFLDKVPDHAAVDQAVRQARRRLRRGAGDLANAVLRKLAGIVGERTHEPWGGDRKSLPLSDGAIVLKRPLLPDPSDTMEYWSIATSHPVSLVTAWFEHFGNERAEQLLLHDLVNPPIFLQTTNGPELWSGNREELAAHLADHSDRWIQDPTSAEPVRATSELQPQRILDYCAGRGTKTRQLVALHPDARIIATDADPGRLEDLRSLQAPSSRAGLPQIEILPIDRLDCLHGEIDLLVLDVPCSNTGVLARRLEARYRYSPKGLVKLADLQRSIINRALALLKPGGTVLYSTCSIEEIENQPQARRIAQLINGNVMQEQLTLPGGENKTYRDGGYWALIR